MFSARTKDLMENVSGVLAWVDLPFSQDKLDGWMVYFLAITDSAADDEFDQVMKRFSFPPSRTRDLVRQCPEMRKALSLRSWVKMFRKAGWLICSGVSPWKPSCS